MDSKDHPVVQQGIKAAEITSDVSLSPNAIKKNSF